MSVKDFLEAIPGGNYPDKDGRFRIGTSPSTCGPRGDDEQGSMKASSVRRDRKAGRLMSVRAVAVTSSSPQIKQRLPASWNSALPCSRRSAQLAASLRSFLSQVPSWMCPFERATLLGVRTMPPSVSSNDPTFRAALPLKPRERDSLDHVLL